MRSLILAGGGVKVGFQAGVLQVWLDEAGITFDHADGASGGCFNLAMYCQGMSGKQIADNWRNLEPVAGVDLNWEHYWKLAYAPSLFTLDAYREKVFPAWGLDWDKIRAGRLGTFNVCNFSKKDVEVVTNDRMNEDWLVASVSLPMWFPPVKIGDETFLDAVYLTDANVEEAIRRGADEIWAIWTVSTKDVWDDGFTAQYFQIIEIVADGRFFPIWRRIEKSNQEIAAGRQGEFGRHITLKLIQAEVPIHYLINFSKDRMNLAVNQGVDAARAWCEKEGIPLKAGAQVGVGGPKLGLEFTETMHGHTTRGEHEFQEGAHAKDRERTRFRLTIGTDDLDRFLDEPNHEGSARGWVEIGSLGGKREVEKGVFNLLVSGADPARKQMLYRLFFRDEHDNPFTLSGVKQVNDSKGFDVWKDTTTLFTRIYRGHVSAEQEAAAELYASGILILNEIDLIRQLGTFKVEAPSLKGKAEALARFGKFFLGSLWDVYASRFLTYAPI
ncbi:MAG: hypothetical protein HC897_04675 [Thermoanaerobaculia bacterium]|nr:hypothetical protein [Thermoanaerobaculia bacterium]